MSFKRLMRTMDSSRSFILFAAFAFFFFVRTTLCPLSHDDYGYAFIWDGAHGGNLEAMQFGSPEIEHRDRIESIGDIFKSLTSHYFDWGGRIFAHAFVQFFIWIGKPYFDIANTIIFIFLVLTIINLANTWLKISRTALVWIFFTMFFLMASSLMSIFWLTGSCNYMWMTFFQLFFLTPYVKALRSHEAANSTLNVVLMIILGLCAGWSNEAGALATVCLTFFLLVMCKVQGVFRPWMFAGFVAVSVGCAFMLLAPGNFVRMEFAHPNFVYSKELFLSHMSNGFLRVVAADFIALIPIFIYFARRTSAKINMTEILMLAFTATGFLVPIALLFSPEYNARISITSLSFILVASSSAILELERQNLKAGLLLPKKFLRGVSILLTISFVSYFATLIYVDISIFNAARRQVRYIQRNADLDPIPMPRMQIRHRFESIHGDRSAAEELDYFAGIEPKLNSCRNSCVAQYYGVKHVIAVVE
ncbi:MAG: hypothetical protein IJL12_07800 [Selenomonadaceae bacterium]|nr:hypothetical protein [Selenomonadaceae bacterium]MBQ6132226.1 hypothetical protein [Selenomonadaceae bacterium]